jgi:hypothetical protein
MIFNKDKGLVLGTVIMSLVLITLTGLVFLRIVSGRHYEFVDKYQRQKLLWIAEAGIERSMAILLKDLNSGTTNNSWSDGKIDTYNLTQSNTDYYTLLSDTPFGAGSYRVELMNISDGLGGSIDDGILVRSQSSMDVYKHGALKTMKTIIDVHLKAKNMSPWNNAIFAGGNGSGTLNGNVSICGSM